MTELLISATSQQRDTSPRRSLVNSKREQDFTGDSPTPVPQKQSATLGQSPRSNNRNSQIVSLRESFEVFQDPEDGDLSAPSSTEGKTLPLPDSLKLETTALLKQIQRKRFLIALQLYKRSRTHLRRKFQRGQKVYLSELFKDDIALFFGETASGKGTPIEPNQDLRVPPESPPNCAALVKYISRLREKLVLPGQTDFEHIDDHLYEELCRGAETAACQILKQMGRMRQVYTDLVTAIEFQPRELKRFNLNQLVLEEAKKN